jgi:hypothetical protein
MIVVEYHLTAFGRFASRRSVIVFYNPVSQNIISPDRPPRYNDPLHKQGLKI